MNVGVRLPFAILVTIPCYERGKLVCIQLASYTDRSLVYHEIDGILENSNIYDSGRGGGETIIYITGLFHLDGHTAVRYYRSQR
jgi:hypothetical protein